MPLASGTRIGVYDIVAPLGAGGMGEVFEVLVPGSMFRAPPSLTTPADDGIVVVVEIDSNLLATLATRDDLAVAVAPLATREELNAAIVPLATREELNAAIAAAVAPLATREEMNAAIAAAVAPLATREEMNAAIAAAIAPLATREEMKAEIREEGDRTRRYFDVVAERLETSIKIFAEGHVHLDAKIDGVRRELNADTADLDRRVTRLDNRRRPR